MHPLRRRARLAVAAARQACYLLLLPRQAAAFYARAVIRAIRRRDYSSLCGATRPRELVPLLRAASGCSRIVEIGTGTAWTAACLALSNRDARVTSYDIEANPYREPYIKMLDPATRDRLDLMTRDGGDPTDHTSVDLVFIDASHECRDTIRTFKAWEPQVICGGVIAFHDYADPAWPGVTEATTQLDLDGEVHGHLFVWTKREDDDHYERRQGHLALG